MTISATPTTEDQAKASIFAFLSRVFSAEPSQDTVDTVCNMAADAGVSLTGDISLENLRQEYLSLFVIPGPKFVAPYESVYRDRWQVPEVLKRGSNPTEGHATIKGLLMGESTLQIRGIFEEAEISPIPDIPDHIGSELYLLARLYAFEGETAAKQRRTLVTDHIQEWIGPLAERVAECGRSGHYAGALELARLFLQEEARPG